VLNDFINDVTVICYCYSLDILIDRKSINDVTVTCMLIDRKSINDVTVTCRLCWLTGSPFVVKVTNASDAGQVSVSGPGICDGVLDKFSSTFTVETTGAGCGQLTVKVRGPKGR